MSGKSRSGRGALYMSLSTSGAPLSIAFEVLAAATGRDGTAAGLGAQQLRVCLVLYALRFCTHLRLGYLSLPRQPHLRARLWLDVLVLVDACLIAGWLTLARKVGDAGNAQQLLALQLPLAVLVFLIGLGTLELASRIGLPRGSDWVPALPPVRWFRTAVDTRCSSIPWAQRFVADLTETTPSHAISLLLASLVSTLVVAALVALGLASTSGSPTAGDSLRSPASAPSSSHAPEHRTEADRRPSVDHSYVDVPDATYEELCGPTLPGEGAPPAARRSLAGLWLGSPGGDGSPRLEGAGARAAGCGGPAEREPGSSIWYAVGYCGGTFRSVAVVRGDGNEPALVYQHVGEDALALLRAGTYRSTTGRFDIGDGDAYLVETEHGTLTYIRSQKNTGGTETSHGVCRDPGVGEPYVRLSEGATTAWVREMQVERRWLWPARDLSLAADGSDLVLSPDVRQETVTARIHCETSIRCDLVSHGSTVPVSAVPVSRGDLDAFLP